MLAKGILLSKVKTDDILHDEWTTKENAYQGTLEESQILRDDKGVLLAHHAG